MPASTRRDPITIQQLDPTKTPNALGEPDVVDDTHWINYFPCFAEVLVKGTRDFVRAGMAEADCSHIVRVPWSSETSVVTATNFRIVLQVTGEKLHITDAYRKDQTTREMEILCVN
jgi:hypothetical protein